jgi:hypothetical protein
MPTRTSSDGDSFVIVVIVVVGIDREERVDDTHDNNSPFSSSEEVVKDASRLLPVEPTLLLGSDIGQRDLGP